MAITASTNEQLLSAVRVLNTHVRNLADVVALDHQPAVNSAEALEKIAFQYRQEICQLKPGQCPNDVLQGKHITFPVVCKLINLLTTPELQFNHAYIRALVKSTRIFIELFVAQNMSHRMRQTTSDAIRGVLRDAIHVIPQEEVECRFELKCCRAALKNVRAGEPAYKKHSKKYLPEIGIGAMTAIIPTLSKDPQVPDVTQVIKPVIELLKDVYKDMPKLWYREIWVFRWQTIAYPINSMAAYEHYENKFCEKASKDRRLNLFLIQLFWEIINNEDKDEEGKKIVENELQVHLVVDPKISLIAFAKNRWADEYDKYWQVRHVALSYLKKLVLMPIEPNSKSIKQEDVCSKLCREVLIDRYRDNDEDPLVRKNACDIVAALADIGYRNDLRNCVSACQRNVPNKEPIILEIKTAKERRETLTQLRENPIENESVNSQVALKSIENQIEAINECIELKQKELKSIQFEEDRLAELERLLNA